MGLSKDELTAAIAVLDTVGQGMTNIHAIDVKARGDALDRTFKERQFAEDKKRWDSEFELAENKAEFEKTKFEYEQQQDEDADARWQAEFDLKMEERKTKMQNRHIDLVASYGAENIIWKIPGKDYIEDDGVSTVDPESIVYEEAFADNSIPFVKTDNEGFNIDNTPEMEMWKIKNESTLASDLVKMKQSFALEYQAKLMEDRKELKADLLKEYDGLKPSDITAKFTEINFDGSIDSMGNYNDEVVQANIDALQSDKIALENYVSQLDEQYNYYLDNVNKYVGENRLIDPDEFQQMLRVHRIQNQAGQIDKEIDQTGLLTAYREQKLNAHDRAKSSKAFAVEFENAGQAAFTKMHEKHRTMSANDIDLGTSSLANLYTLDVGQGKGKFNYSPAIIKLFQENASWKDFHRQLYSENDAGDYAFQDIISVLEYAHPNFMEQLNYNYESAKIFDEEVKLYNSDNIANATSRLSIGIEQALGVSDLNSVESIDTALNTIFEDLYSFQASGVSDWDDFERMFENAEMQLKIANNGIPVDLGPYFDYYLDSMDSGVTPSKYINSEMGGKDFQDGFWPLVDKGISMSVPDPTLNPVAPGSIAPTNALDVPPNIVPIQDVYDIQTTSWDPDTYDLEGLYDIITELEWDYGKINEEITMDTIEGIQHYIGAEVDGIWGDETMDKLSKILRKS